MFDFCSKLSYTGDLLSSVVRGFHSLFYNTFYDPISKAKTGNTLYNGILTFPYNFCAICYKKKYKYLIGITFIGYDRTQKIGKPNNWKVLWARKPKGPKWDNQNRIQTRHSKREETASVVQRLALLSRMR
jgi:hypothetical protein